MKPKKIIIISLLLALLVMVRIMENWFYDPLISYFEYDYLHETLPEINTLKLIFHLILRYLINTIISILIIWVIFKDKNLIRFSIWFYLIVLILFLQKSNE